MESTANAPMSEQGKNVPDQNPKKKASFRFKLTDEEIKAQVEGYSTLKFQKTSRGQASIMIGIVFVLTLLALFIMRGASGIPTLNVLVILEIAVYAALGIGVIKGVRWASMAVLVVWTLDKALQLATAPAQAVTILIWWFIVAKFLYNSHQVETARAAMPEKK